MPVFEYEALSASGVKTQGVLEADSPAEARQEIRDMDLVPVDVKTVSALAGSNQRLRSQPRVAGEALAIMTRQLSTLLDSGLPLDDSLAAVAKQSNKTAKRILSDLRSKVREGQTLASAMQSYRKTFSSLYCASVVAGEASGNLPQVMNQLAIYMEERSDAGKKIALALVYPLLLSIVSISVVVGLLVWVIPGLVEVITGAGQELPWLTRALINSSQFLVNYGMLILLVLAAIWLGFLALMRFGGIKPWVDAALLHTPLVSSTICDRVSSRYTGTLGILTASGISLVDAMGIAESVTGNLEVQKRVRAITQQVQDGGQLAQSMDRSQLFNGMVIQLVSVGEQSGSLAAMLQRAARVQDDILQRRMATFVALFEPLTLLFMGAVVMAIVLAVMLPILNLNQLVQ